MVDDIERWLDELGLAKYVSVFLAEEIELLDLQELTDADLKEMGLPIGPRRRVLKAVAQLATTTTDGPWPTPTNVATTLGEGAAARNVAERRQLTILFCDLVGSTELASRIDPEEFGEILRRYQKSSAIAIERFGGYIAKVLGDGILAYFGWPEANEDQTIQAVHAALEAVKQVRELSWPSGIRLEARAGVATGLVVIGELVGEVSHDLDAVAGDTPNLAARLQGAAMPNQVLIDATTRNLIGHAFDLADPIHLSLKGYTTPVEAWRAVAVHEADTRFDATRNASTTHFIGRESELDRILERWARAKAGEGQAILVSGEAGIGKSRLLEAFRSRISDEPHTGLVYQCSPFHIGSAFHPIRQKFIRDAGIEATDDEQARLDKLRMFLAPSVSDSLSEISVLAALLGLPPVDPKHLDDLTPHQLRERIRRSLLNQLLALSRQNPVLLVFEDVHWIDPSSAELLLETVSAIIDAPVLMFLTYRPEYHVDWPMHSHVTALTLSRLSQSEGAALVHSATGVELPPAVVERIISRTDGVPLFLEELSRAVAETEAEPINTEIPSTLQASLNARLDRLGIAKEIAQAGAVIGREFQRELVQRLLGLPTNAFDREMQLLQQSGLIVPRPSMSGEAYAFRHALIQEAAANSLLRERRRNLHLRVAEILEGDASVADLAKLELIAHHLSEAGSTLRAIDAWRNAAAEATRASADDEAALHLRRALDLARTHPDEEGRDVLTLDLLAGLSRAIITSEGHAAPELGQVVSEAMNIASRLNNPISLFPILSAHQVLNFVSRHVDHSIEVSEGMIERARRANQPGAMLFGKRLLGTGNVMLGRGREACRLADEAIDGYDTERDNDQALHYVQDNRIAALTWSSLPLWYMGHPDQARRRSKEAIRTARSKGNANTLAQSLSIGGGVVHDLLGDTSALADYTEELRSLTAAHNLPFWHAFSDACLGRCYYREGKFDVAVDHLKSSLDQFADQRVIRWQSLFLSWLAEALDARGDHRGARKACAQSKKTLTEAGDYWHRPDIMRLDAVLAEERSLEALQSALEAAWKMDSPAWALRAAIDIVRRGEQQGTDKVANWAQLASIMEKFEEGFDTGDLRRARSLLARLK